MVKIPRYLKYLPYDTKYAFRHILLNALAGSPAVTRGLRIVIYRLGGIRVGRANIYPRVKFLSDGPVTIATNVMINVGVTIDNRSRVTILEGVSIAPEVYIGTSTHQIGGPGGRAGVVESRAIVIGRGAWIGARAIILPGVTIGAGSIIAAGSVVTKDTDPDTLYAGVPARAVRNLLQHNDMSES